MYPLTPPKSLHLHDLSRLPHLLHRGLTLYIARSIDLRAIAWSHICAQLGMTGSWCKRSQCQGHSECDYDAQEEVGATQLMEARGPVEGEEAHCPCQAISVDVSHATHAEAGVDIFYENSGNSM